MRAVRRLAAPVQRAESLAMIMGEAAHSASPSIQPHEPVVSTRFLPAAVSATRSFLRSRLAAAGQVLAASITSLVLLAPRIAGATPRYDVRATIAEDGAEVALDEVVTDAAWSAATRSLSLWLYADRQRRTPPSFDEFTAERLYVGNASYGGYGPLDVEVDGCPPERIAAADARSVDPVAGRTVNVPVCAAATQPLRLHVRGSLALAARYGTLGRARNGIQLGDPWYPLVVTTDAPAPARGTHRVSVASPGERVIAFAGGAIEGHRASWEVDDATHAAAFLLDDAHVAREDVRGVAVTFVTKRAPVPNGSGPAGWADPFDPDAARAIAGTTERAIAFARRLGFVASPVALPRTIASKLVVVEVEERQRLAVALPGMVAVSDRAFRLFPVEAIERFHELGLRRRLFAALLQGTERATEPERDLPFVADLDAMLLVDLSIRAEREPRESPADLIGFAGFHPAVDQLLYAPQVAFRAEYFSDLDGKDPDRDGAERAHNPWPVGHFVLEKLRDRLGHERFARATRLHLFEGLSWREAAERAYGAPLDEFFRTWIGPPRSIAYRLGAIASTKHGARYEHAITIERLGETWVREPVVVEVRDEAGAKVRGVWDVAGSSGRVVVTTDRPFASATLDPDGRLVQDPALSDEHPKWDDSTDHVFRPPIFNSFAANLSVTQARPDVTLDFALRRKYDVREGYGLRLASTARGVGGSVRYLRGVGELRDLNNTVGNVSVGVSALRSNTGFARSKIPVTEGGLVVGAGYDTRRQLYAPATGFSLSVGSFVGVDREDRDCEDRGCDHLALNVSARAQQLFWTSVTNVVAVTGGAAFARCPALPQSLPGLGSRQILRGYEVDELLGCATAYAILEDRWSPIRGLYVNAADLAWGRRLEFVPFGAVGTLSSRDTAADLFQRYRFEVGLGLRAHYDYAGIQPGVLALDFAVPLNRTDACRTTGATGACTSYRSPIGFWVSFEQTY